MSQLTEFTTDDVLRCRNLVSAAGLPPDCLPSALRLATAGALSLDRAVAVVSESLKLLGATDA